MSDHVNDRICELAAGIFDVPDGDVTIASTSADIPSWDSFAQLNLLVAIEDEFELAIDPTEVGEMADLGALCQYVSAAVVS